jgi:hypothetical protein
VTRAAELAFVHLIVRKTLARTGKEGRVAGETQKLIVLPV